MLSCQSTQKKKRNRDSLTMNSRDLKYAKITLIQNCYLEGSKARLVLSKDQIITRKIINTEASMLSRNCGKEFVVNTIGKSPTLSPHLLKQRKAAMNYFFNLYGCPLPETLYNDGYFKSIMHILNIPNNSYTCTKKAMNDILESHFSGSDYDNSVDDDGDND